MSDSEQPVLEPIKKVRLYETIVKQLQRHIIDGSLKAGQRLPPERELAENLGVSRTSVREALRALEMMGYVESRVGMDGGTFVKEMSFSSLMSAFSGSLLDHDAFTLQLLDVRMLLEVEGARLAATQRTRDELEQMRDAVAEMERELAAGESGVRGDNAFHHAIAKASGNRVLYEFTRMCGDLFALDLEDHLRTRPKAQKTAVKHHRAMVEAIERRDAKAAQDLMREHILVVIKAIKGSRERRRGRAQDA